MERWKWHSQEETRTWRKSEGRRSDVEMEKVRREKMQVREKVGKSRNTVFFPVFCGSRGSKGRLAKAAGAEVAGQMRHEKLHAVVARSTFWSQKWQNTSCLGALLEVEMWKKCTPLWREAHLEVKSVQSTPCLGRLLEVEMWKKCTPLWREAHFEVKMWQNTPCSNIGPTFGSWDVEKVHAVVARSTFWSKKWSRTKHLSSRTTFGSWDVEKVHAVVARSTFGSKKCTKHLSSERLLGVCRCGKSARRCGAKHILKSKVSKHLGFGPLFDDSMAIRCRKSARRCGAKHISKSKVSKTEGFEPLLLCQMSFCWQMDGYGVCQLVS